MEAPAIYDVIVLGGGPGGYSAAEKAAAAGLSTLCVEEKALGGTCLNEGCIPTKALLYSGKTYLHAKEGAVYGVTADNVALDHSAVIDRKDAIVKKLVGGVAATLRSKKARVVNARGSIEGKGADGYRIAADGEVYTAKNLIIATGSSCTVPPIPGLTDGLSSGFVLTNREFLDMRELPESMAVLGGGVIGLEMATYLAMAGVKVTVLEMMDHIAGPTDTDLGLALKKHLERMGMTFLLGAKVTGIGEGTVLYEEAGAGKELTAEKVLLAIGRRPNTEGLDLASIQVETNRGAVIVDEHMKTSAPNVYAIGDVTAKSMLAHTAYRQADVAVNTILGKADRMRYSAIPSVIYTVPELASAGETEASAKASGKNVRVIKLPMAYSGRYLVENEESDGIMKLVFDADKNTLIGAQFLCDHSSEFIGICSAFIEMELTASDIAEVILPHPTVAEIIREAVNQY